MSENPADAPTDAWHERLRRRLLDVARSRVSPDESEEIVRRIMASVEKRGIDTERHEVDGSPPVAWCLRRLRDEIATRHRSEVPKLPSSERRSALRSAGVPFEAWTAHDQISAIGEAIHIVRIQDPRGGRYLQKLADGVSIGDVARAEGLTPPAMYHRMSVCRQELRELLRTRGL